MARMNPAKLRAGGGAIFEPSGSRR
jgi:hypothetical protein